MSGETITESELENICKDICFGMGHNQYEELSLEVTEWCDLITTYEDDTLEITQKNFCDGNEHLEVFYKGKEVFGSSKEEIVLGFPIFYNRKEDFQAAGFHEEEIELRRGEGDTNALVEHYGYGHKLEIRDGNTRWKNYVTNLHNKNWEKIRRKLEWGYLTQLRLPFNIFD